MLEHCFPLNVTTLGEAIMSINIYLITNKINSKKYVGKTYKSIIQRFKEHCSKSKKSNTHLHRAIRKYGSSNFTIELIEETNLPNVREPYWIKKLNSEYNMTEGGDGGDTSNSPNFKKAMFIYHSRKKPKDYATYGMLGKIHPNKGKSLKANCCPVSCQGIEYSSVGEAEKAFPGISIRKRLDNIKYPDFYRLREKTKRK